MTTLDDQEAGLASLPEVPPETVRTYSGRMGVPDSVTLCLATHWLDGDPMPIVCGRAAHEDDMHLTTRNGGCGPVLQISWYDEESA